MFASKNPCLSLVLLVSCLTLASAQFLFPGHNHGRGPRGLYGPPPISSGWSSGWNGPSIELPPSHSNHITRDEVLSLLAAWKAVEAKPKPTPAPEPEADPEPEPEAPAPAPEPEPEAPEPAPEAPAGPGPAVPLTVSLPAFVPIQLSAMYTAPIPVPGAGLGAFGFGGAIGGGSAAAGAAAAGSGASAAGAAAAQSRLGRPIQRRINSNIRFPVANPRSFASANYVAPRPRVYRTIGSETDQAMSIDVLPPPPFLGNPVQFVPSNWQ
ncbi:translation initiation factor IF-2 [Drosophila grimshawi]|uniref:GH12674 n=1 Tax=Drosophila grimshawi TaxID=7222 RepID=B4JKJ4_DROGR|nr:translation initiation factor IF-2 [Drosophila grimshawi]EDW00097.1 GH12674 [Drosophila grimshawi]